MINSSKTLLFKKSKQIVSFFATEIKRFLNRLRVKNKFTHKAVLLRAWVDNFKVDRISVSGLPVL